MSKSNKPIKMYKGDLEGRALPSAYEKVWKPLGWKLRKGKPAQSDLTTGDTSSEVSNSNDEKKEGTK